MFIIQILLHIYIILFTNKNSVIHARSWENNVSVNVSNQTSTKLSTYNQVNHTGIQQKCVLRTNLMNSKITLTIKSYWNCTLSR